MSDYSVEIKLPSLVQLFLEQFYTFLATFESLMLFSSQFLLRNVKKISYYRDKGTNK